MIRAKDRPPPGPSYMSEEQMGQHFHASPSTPSRLRECTIFEEREKEEEDAHSHNPPTASYLQNLRANKTRPVGSRPPPPSKFGSLRRAETETTGVPHAAATNDGRPGLPHSSSMPIMPPQTMAKERPKSSLGMNSPFAGRPLARPPSATPDDSEPTKAAEKPALRRPHSAIYMEQGTRWIEKQEAKSLRMALEDMDLAEEQKVHKDAQDEAADLVWRHQNPNAPMPNPDLAYENPDLNRDYRSHLRKGSYSRSHSKEAVPQASGRSSSSSTRPSTSTSSRPSMEGKRRVTPPAIQEEAEAKPDWRSHLRKGSNASSHDRESISHGAADVSSKRASFSRPFSPPSSGTSSAAPERPTLPHAATTGDVTTRKVSGSKGKGYGDLAAAVKKDIDNARRRSSSGKRILSGEKRFYMHPNDRIYEDPQEEATPPKKSPSPGGMPIPDLRPTPSPPIQAPAIEPPPSQPATGYVRKNPFARVRMQQQMLERTQSEPVVHKPPPRFDRVEIQRNPPTQSRNAGYMSNEPTPATPPRASEDSGVEDSLVEDAQSPGYKDGKEIRGDDIRAATSKHRKDRSTNLPQPTVVSDKPGRPIVSFQKDWKPKEVVLEGMLSAAAPSASVPPKADPVGSLRSNESPRPSSRGSVRASPFHRNSIPRFEPPKQSAHEPSKPAVPAISVPDTERSSSRPPVPMINLPDDEPMQKPPIPTICLPDDDEPHVPSIVLPEEPEFASSSNNSMPSIPTIAVNDAPSISVSGPGFSTRPSPARHNTALPSTHTAAPTHRPLPTPTQHDPHTHHANTTPLPRTKSTPHYTPSLRQASAQCAHCALPIAGRILSAAGQRFHPGCFVCHECTTNLELVAFYPEPETERSKRLERIALRQHGGPLPEDLTEDQLYELEAADGEPSLRFYCHLDFHERFSPRCKSCKTPIEGEVIVACGAEWHAGHFFCAQCGDPFDSTTPFVEKDGYAWCVNCHTNRYSAKCKGCRKPVTDVVVKALGFEWHANCFACVVSLRFWCNV